ncbi:hypothetical protein [Microbacterium sp. USHLN272]|uniref:hypothetical protein n=1 Tax=Microbacterium sp. USHLN272 TaxID=3081287 RepID=UPI003015B71A
MGTGSLLLCALFFALLGILTAHRYRSWLAPAPIWNLCWGVLFLSTAVLGYGFDVPAAGAIALVFLAALYSLPGFLLNSTVANLATTRAGGVPHRFVPPVRILLLLALIGAVGAIQVGAELGTSLFSVRSVGQLFDLGQQNAVNIFRGETNFSVIVNVAFAGLQFGTALAGVRVALRPSRGAIVVTLLLTAIAFLWSSITTQRSYLLVPLVWFVAGYLATLVWAGRRGISRRAAALAVAGGSIVLLLVVFLRAVRTTGADAGLSESSFAPTRLWLAGYIPTFAAWFEQSETTEASFGIFNGVVALIQPLLGIRVSDDGGESNYFAIGAGLSSNAGTSMMRIVGTGGLVWGGLTVILLGLIAHVIYRRTARGGAVAAAAYVGVLVSTLWSTNAWFLGYGGRVLALVLMISTAVIAVRATDRDDSSGDLFPRARSKHADNGRRKNAPVSVTRPTAPSSPPPSYS